MLPEWLMNGQHATVECIEYYISSRKPIDDLLADPTISTNAGHIVSETSVSGRYEKPPLAEPQTALGKNRRQTNKQTNKRIDRQKDIVIA